MTRSSLLALVLLASAGLARAAPTPRPLIAPSGIDLGSIVAGTAFCETSQRAVLALSTGELVAIDATGALHKLGSIGRNVANVPLVCDRTDRIFAAISASVVTVGNGSSSSYTGSFSYARLTRLLDDGTVALVDNDGVVWLWDGTQLVKSWQAKLAPGMPTGRVALRGDGKALAVFAQDATTIHHADGREAAAPRAFSAEWLGTDLVYVHRGGLARWAPGMPITNPALLDAKLSGFQLALAGRRAIVTTFTTAEIRELDAAGSVIGSATATRLPGGYKRFAFGSASFGVVAVGSTAHVFDLTRSSVVIDEQHPLESPRVLAFSPDGGSLAMLGGDSDVLVATLRNAVVHRLVSPAKRLYNGHLAWTGTGIYTSGESGYLHFDRKGAVTHKRAMFLHAFTHAGEAIENDRGRGIIIQRKSGPVSYALGADPIQRIDVDNDHAAIRRGRHIELYRLDDKASSLAPIATSPELRFSQFVAVAGSKTPRAFYVDDRKVRVLDANGDKELAILGSFPTALVVSKDRRRVAVANQAGGISIFDADSGKHVTGLLLAGSVSALAWSPDGKRLAVASSAGVTIHPVR